MTASDAATVAPQNPSYGSAEHAAAEALSQSNYAHEGYISTDSETVAKVVVEGLRERGFIVAKDHIRCHCGWQGLGNHDHDRRLGWATENGPSGAQEKDQK